MATMETTSGRIGCTTASRIVLYVFLAVTLSGVPGLAQPKDEAAKDERAQRYREMERRAKAIRLFQSKGGTDVEVPLLEKPLFRFDDPARLFHDGTMWAWGRSGRPLALVTLERYKTSWSYELISLSEGGIFAELGERGRWTPRGPNSQYQRFPNAPTPAENEAQRMLQMKALAGRFIASETAPEGGRYELRLLPQPIHRYSAEDGKLTEGALFIFAYGTNPEVLIVIECGRPEPKSVAWHYGFAPLSTAALSVRLDGSEVWKMPVPTTREPLREPYTGFADPDKDVPK
jgi:hypothetical protein